MKRTNHKRKTSYFTSKLFSILSIAMLITALTFSGLIVGTIVYGGFGYLKEALKTEEILFSLRTSLMTASISTIICLFIGIPAAYALTRIRLPFRRVMNIIIELPLSLPYLVLGLSLLMIFSSEAGKFFRDLGIRIVFDMRGIIVAHIAVNLPFVIRLIRTEFSNIDPRMELIAATLGASKWKRFLTITLPMSANTIISATILAWSRALGEFGATLMLVGVTRMKTETLPSSIYLAISTGDNKIAMATAVILLIVSCLTLTITNLLSRRSYSRIKENSKI